MNCNETTNKGAPCKRKAKYKLEYLKDTSRDPDYFCSQHIRNYNSPYYYKVTEIKE